MQQVGAQAFSSLTDMIIDWAETGKLNVKDFASTFLQSVGAHFFLTLLPKLQWRVCRPLQQ